MRILVGIGSTVAGVMHLCNPIVSVQVCGGVLLSCGVIMLLESIKVRTASTGHVFSPYKRIGSETTTANYGNKSISSESEPMERPKYIGTSNTMCHLMTVPTCVTCEHYRQYGSMVPGQETRDCCGWGHDCDSKSYCHRCRPRRVNSWTTSCIRYLDSK